MKYDPFCFHRIKVGKLIALYLSRRVHKNVLAQRAGVALASSDRPINMNRIPQPGAVRSLYFRVNVLFFCRTELPIRIQ